MPTDHAAYVLDNAKPTASRMHDLLSTILDSTTTARLAAIGVPAGARCWEIGAGNGSIAAWLADRAGPTGSVIASDIDPQHIRTHPRVQAVTHDVATQIPPDPDFGLGFDLIHARLVLAHLPARWQIVTRLADALAPGGVLLLEDWGRHTGIVLASPVPDAALTYEAYTTALIATFRRAGNDPRWAEQAPQAMTDAGLVDVTTTLHASSWTGSTAGCLLPLVVSEELRPRLLADGATAADLDRLPNIMIHPCTTILGNPLFSTAGRRPA